MSVTSKIKWLASIVLAAVLLTLALMGGKWGTSYTANAGVYVAPIIDVIRPNWDSRRSTRHIGHTHWIELWYYTQRRSDKSNRDLHRLFNCPASGHRYRDQFCHHRYLTG